MPKKSEAKPVARSSFSNVAVREVNRKLLGTTKFPILVHRGEKGEASQWFATFRGLPGYLGFGDREASAIADLWAMVDGGPVYDVSQSHGLEPTPKNIRKMLDQARHRSSIIADNSLSVRSKDAEVTHVAKQHGVSRNSLRPLMARAAKWEEHGGIDQFIAKLGRDHQSVAAEVGDDPQRFLENNPERARMLLARQKFPQR